MKRKLTLTAALAVLLLVLWPHASGAKNRICIIGTCHEPRSYLNADTLYNLLERLRPDVILVELDSAYFTPGFDFDLERYPDLLSTNENIASQRYKTAYAGAHLRPYDIGGRNEFYRENDYFRRENALLGEIVRLNGEGKLPDAAARDFRMMWAAMNLLGGIRYASLREMNGDAAQKAMQVKQLLVDELMISITESTPQLNPWSDFARLRRDFWERRNRAMAANIIRAAACFPGATVVVLTGQQHKYFLEELLSEAGVAMEEYWEIAERKKDGGE